MMAAGYSPSVRLFEAAACAAPILSDDWAGLDELLEPGREVLLPKNAEAVLTILDRFGDGDRLALGSAARARVLNGHTAAHRSLELERMLMSAVRRNPERRLREVA